MNPRRGSTLTTTPEGGTGIAAAHAGYIADLFATAAIPRGNGPVQPFPVRLSPITDIPVLLNDGTRSSPGAVMSATHTDGWMVVHRAVVLAEEYLQGMAPDTRHLPMSVSKSLIATVVGALAADGTLELDRPVSDYVPELAKSGYSGAHIRHLLDMRSGHRVLGGLPRSRRRGPAPGAAIGWAPSVRGCSTAGSPPSSATLPDSGR